MQSHIDIFTLCILRSLKAGSGLLSGPSKSVFYKLFTFKFAHSFRGGAFNLGRLLEDNFESTNGTHEHSAAVKRTSSVH